MFVNGTTVWEEGKHTGALPGDIVRGAGYQKYTGANYDLSYLNAKIIDGTGAGWFYGDLAVKKGKIAAITPAGMLRGVASKRSIGGTSWIDPGTTFSTR